MEQLQQLVIHMRLLTYVEWKGCITWLMGETVPFKFNSVHPVVFLQQHLKQLVLHSTLHWWRSLLHAGNQIPERNDELPGVLFKDPEVMAKIAATHKLGKPVWWSCSRITRATSKGLYSCGYINRSWMFYCREALDKLSFGMKILIREGSAAKTLKLSHRLLNEHFKMMMFCSDDKHPDSLVQGHINQLCARAVAMGVDVLKCYRWLVWTCESL